MNTFRVKENVDSGYDFVCADYYFIDDRNYLVFYRRGEEYGHGDTEVATFNPWVSVVMMDEVESEDQNE